MLLLVFGYSRDEMIVGIVYPALVCWFVIQCRCIVSFRDLFNISLGAIFVGIVLFVCVWL